MSGTLVLLSGGQDSGTCLYWAQLEIENNRLTAPLETVSFFYGQRHLKELECAKWLSDNVTAKHHTLDISELMVQINANSALINEGMDVSKTSLFDKDLPASYVPGRNLFFLSAAAVLGCWRGIRDLVAGFTQTDYSGYPDCRQGFVESMEETLFFGLEKTIHIHTPLMFKSKAETWRLAKELGVLDIIVEHTHTDYNGNRIFNEWGYGTEDNPASVLRANGYREAKERGWV